jgi:copper chaperone CopZ
VVTKTIRVAGMTCAHCASAVSAELGQIPGVVGVDVALATGVVTISSRHDVDDGAVRGAVDEAGYEVVER